MITAPMLQHELDVNLPVAAGTPQVTAEDQVVLTVNKQGNIYLDQTPYTLDTLRPKLQTLYQTRHNKDIFLRADTDVPYGKVLQVMDEVKKAGIVKLGMITQPPPTTPTPKR
jgi:biopolymer transport protein TolR